MNEAPISLGSGKWPQSMIWLTRLNNRALMVNSDLIKFAENSPDTVITLITGEKLIVKETIETVVERVVQFRRSIQHGVNDGPGEGCERKD